jgi:hypothetical protein
MKRHPFNIFSLIFGVGMILLAAWAAWTDLPISKQFIVDISRWAVPVAAILVGAALLSPLFTSQRNKKTTRDGTDGDHPVVVTDPFKDQQ